MNKKNSKTIPRLEIPKYNILIGNATDKGKVRQHNEDSMSHFDTALGYCMIVCDGMGGHAAGDIASQKTIQFIKEYLQSPKITFGEIAHSIIHAMEYANYHLREMVVGQPQLRGMGTTCVLAIIHDGQFYVGHVGDSRIYLIQNRKIKQLTKDHSTIQEMIDKNLLTEDEAKFSEKRNEITKAIGIFNSIAPTVIDESIKLNRNDQIVLCTDGLTAHVNNELINETINNSEDVQLATDKLIELANQNGGTDNITVQIAKYKG